MLHPPEPRPQRTHNHPDRDLITPAMRDHNVRMALRRLDERKVHRADGPEVLLHDRVEVPPAILDVAQEPSNDPDVIVGVDEIFTSSCLRIASIPRTRMPSTTSTGAGCTTVGVAARA